jgi:hypothetical protein
MKRYFSAHEDWVLAIVGIFLGALIIFFFVWSVTHISETVAAALSQEGVNAGKVQFNIDLLEKTNLRGLNK